MKCFDFQKSVREKIHWFSKDYTSQSALQQASQSAGSSLTHNSLHGVRNTRGRGSKVKLITDCIETWLLRLVGSVVLEAHQGRTGEDLCWGQSRKCNWTRTFRTGSWTTVVRETRDTTSPVSLTIFWRLSGTKHHYLIKRLQYCDLCVLYCNWGTGTFPLR